MLTLARRRVAALAPGWSVASQGLVALGLNSTTSLIAGAVLGSITGTFERAPGLLILVPAAIGLRGNVFSALGSRLSSAIHQGTYRRSLRLGTVAGDNLAAALLLTTGLSLGLALIAKAIAPLVGVRHTIPLVDLATISIVGGILASAIVVVATIALAEGAVRYGWDLDNLVAPLVSTLGDVLTLPALWLATHLIAHGAGSTGGGWLLVAATAATALYGWRTRWPRLRDIVRQSWPILLAAGTLSTLAGVVVERRLDAFASDPALLILFPAFVSSGGALGGILSSRLSTQLHLGTLDPTRRPSRAARRDAGFVAALAVPVYFFNAVGAHVVAGWLGQSSPGLGPMFGVALLAATATVAFVLALAYYSSIASNRLGLDPDTYGIPVVTSSVDFFGALALVTAIATLGIT